jgi:hypothetical protein
MNVNSKVERRQVHRDSLEEEKNPSGVTDEPTYNQLLSILNITNIITNNKKFLLRLYHLY